MIITAINDIVSKRTVMAIYLRFMTKKLMYRVKIEHEQAGNKQLPSMRKIFNHIVTLMVGT